MAEEACRGGQRMCCVVPAFAHVDVLNVHTEMRSMEDSGGAGVVIVSSAYQNLPTYGYHVLQRFTQETFGSFLLSNVENDDWPEYFPDVLGTYKNT